MKMWGKSTKTSCSHILFVCYICLKRIVAYTNSDLFRKDFNKTERWCYFVTNCRT